MTKNTGTIRITNQVSLSIKFPLVFPVDVTGWPDSSLMVEGVVNLITSFRDGFGWGEAVVENR
jgi:hypothetical protein